MPDKTVDSGGKRYNLHELDGIYTISKDGSRIGSARSEEDALSVIKSDSGGSDVHVGGAPCFPSSAKVLTPNGEWSIVCFSPGDVLLSFDPVQKRLVERVVTKSGKHPRRRIWNVTFRTNRPALRGTRGHTVLSTRGWCPLYRLRSNDFLVGADGGLFEVEKVFPEVQKEHVYSLITAQEHNFVVDGIVVHNFTWLRGSRTLLHRMFLDGLRIANLGGLVPTAS